MGRVQTQLVSPYPGMGRGNRYQSQGAARALTTSQTGQRGQGMDRGREQGSQAGTSGTQRHVYAITPQVEIANQSVIQGTFLLSRL